MRKIYKLSFSLLSFILLSSSLYSVYGKTPESSNISGAIANYHESYEGNGTMTYGGINGVTEIVDKDYRILMVNGNFIDGADIITLDNKILLPVRIVSEEMGAKVDWDDKTRLVTVKKDNINIKMTINEKKVTINDSPKTLDAPPIIFRDRTYVPIRFISENFGADVEYYDCTDSENSGIVARIPQVVIDDKKYYDYESYSEKEAVERAIDSMKKSYDYFLKTNPKEKVVEDLYEKSIYNMKVEKSVSRYYILSGLQGMYNILFDKYTGDMYRVNFTLGQTILEYNINDVSNFCLAG